MGGGDIFLFAPCLDVRRLLGLLYREQPLTTSYNSDSFIHAACSIGFHPALLTLHTRETGLFNTPSSLKCGPFSRHGNANASEASFPTTKDNMLEHRSYRLACPIQHRSVDGALDHIIPIHFYLCCPIRWSTNGQQVKYQNQQIYKTLCNSSIVAVLVKYSNPDVCKSPQQWLDKIVVSIELHWPPSLTCQRIVESNDEDNMPKSWCIDVWDMCLHSWDLNQNFLKWFKFSSTRQMKLRILCSSVPSYRIWLFA